MENLIDSFASNKTEDKVILYVDILGFGNWISELNEEKEAKVLALYNYLGKQHAGEGGIYKIDENAVKLKPTLSFFSDSIISSFPADAQKRTYNVLAPGIGNWPMPIFDTNIHTFNSAFHQAIQLQTYCILNLGLLTRGSITLGKAYHKSDSNIIFGAAITRAVHLEEELSVTPRIIVDDRITSKHDPNSLKHLQQDSDGYWFVNCLYLDLNIPNLANLRMIRTHIVKGLQEVNDRYRQKWKWMAVFFNKELEKYADLPKSELLVPM